MKTSKTAKLLIILGLVLIGGTAAGIRYLTALSTPSPPQARMPTKPTQLTLMHPVSLPI
jgi:hypothetical protein